MMVDGVARRRTGWLIAAAAAVVAMVVAAFVVVVPQLTSLAPTPPPSTAEGSSDGAADPAGESKRPDDDAAWWRLSPDPMMGWVQSIQVGTLGAGHIADAEVPLQGGAGADANAMLFPMRSVIGPRSGIVVTIGAERETAVLWAVDAASGEVRELARTGDVIVDAQFVAGTSVLFITGDGATGELTGSWLIDAAAGGEPQLVDGLVGDASDINLAARATSIVRLIVSPTGDAAAVHRCGLADVCTLRAVNLGDGTRYEHHIPFGNEPLGLGGAHVYLRAVCMEAFCPGELLDLETGETRPLPAVENRFSFDETVVATADGAVLVTQIGGPAGPGRVAAQLALVVTDLSTGVSRPPIPVALSSMRILGTSSHELGIELPTGWLAVLGSRGDGVAADGETGAFAIDLATGAVLPLPGLGEFLMPQG